MEKNKTFCQKVYQLVKKIPLGKIQLIKKLAFVLKTKPIEKLPKL